MRACPQSRTPACGQRITKNCDGLYTHPMDRIERKVRNAVASTQAEGVHLDEEDIKAAYRLARGQSTAADEIRKLGFIPNEDASQ